MSDRKASSAKRGRKPARAVAANVATPVKSVAAPVLKPVEAQMAAKPVDPKPAPVSSAKVETKPSSLPVSEKPVAAKPVEKVAEVEAMTATVAPAIEAVAEAANSTADLAEPAAKPEIEAAPKLAEAAIETRKILADIATKMTDKAGAVAARSIEPVAKLATTPVETVKKTASAAQATFDASPFFPMMKGLTMATAFDTTKAKEVFGDMNQKAKGAMEKGAKFAEEFQEFAKGNVEAMVASGRVAAKGVEEMAQYGADYGRKSVEQATAAMKSFAGVKSPTELFQLQSDYAKTAVDAMVSETSKFTESYIKLLGDIAQPLTSRYAVAAEKIKTVAA